MTPSQVMEYLEHDLSGLLETLGKERDARAAKSGGGGGGGGGGAPVLSAAHVKSYAKQLVEGVAYMHENHVLHRDLKGSNLLISADGQLKIADWGLARSWASAAESAALVTLTPSGKYKEPRFTNRVITLWYRPPELLLGAERYGAAVDMWSVGCLVAEVGGGRDGFGVAFGKLERLAWRKVSRQPSETDGGGINWRPSSSESITQSLNHSITQSLNHSITQSLNHSITQSLNHSITQSPPRRRADRRQADPLRLDRDRAGLAHLRGGVVNAGARSEERGERTRHRSGAARVAEGARQDWAPERTTRK